MPNGDHLKATPYEVESSCICSFIEYVYKHIKKKVPPWVSRAAGDYYGNVGKLDEAKKLLVECLRSLMGSEVEALVYDAHKEESRELANWWERYLKEEKREDVEREQEQKKTSLKDSALKKLTPAEIEALELKE